MIPKTLNEEKEFSIVIPSRGRVEKLEHLLGTIVDNCYDPDTIEIVVGIDFDDSCVFEYYSMIKGFEVQKKLVIRDHSDNLSDGYYNTLSRITNGKVIWVLNDDCELRSSNWDFIVKNRLSELELENKIAYVLVGGNGVGDRDGSYSAFPMLTRETVEQTGYFHWPHIFSWDADEVLWNAFAMLKNPHGIDRMVKAFDVYMVHLNKENPRLMKEGEGIDEAQNNMIRTYNMGMTGKPFLKYQEMVNNLLRGIERGY